MRTSDIMDAFSSFRLRTLSLACRWCKKFVEGWWGSKSFSLLSLPLLFSSLRIASKHIVDGREEKELLPFAKCGFLWSWIAPLVVSHPISSTREVFYSLRLHYKNIRYCIMLSAEMFWEDQTSKAMSAESKRTQNLNCLALISICAPQQCVVFWTAIKQYFGYERQDWSDRMRAIVRLYHSRCQLWSQPEDASLKRWERVLVYLSEA